MKVWVIGVETAVVIPVFGSAIQDDTAGEMGNGPEQEQNGQAAGDGAHEVDAAGGGMWVVAEQDDKEAAQQDEQWGAGRVGDLELITAGDEFTAVPEAAGGFHRHNINCTGKQTYDPTVALFTLLKFIGITIFWPGGAGGEGKYKDFRGCGGPI